jgi:hypothetical protein
MTTETTEISEQSTMMQQASNLLGEVGNYGFLIVDSLYLIVLGMVVIFCLHKLASVFLYPNIKNNRLLRVIFGTLYV